MIKVVLFLSWFGTAVALFVSTFVFFVAIMKMREMQNEIFTLHWSVRWVCYSALFVGLIMDIMLNWIVLTVVFVEPPHEFLSTTRVIRHKHKSGGFRQALALFFCKNWLTPFDARHCEN